MMLAALLVASQAVLAAYSAPLTRVHIDSREISHTPQLVYVSDDSPGGERIEISGQAAQYILQLEHELGFGAQLTGTVGRASMSFVDRGFDVGGILYGGQARLYAEVLSIESAGRPHALALFTNFRAVRVSASNTRADVSQTALGMGVGFMAEIALGGYVSVLPYAWFSPSLRRDKHVRVGNEAARDIDTGLKLNRPLRAGIDVWFYPFGAASTNHIAASVITSFIDTSGDKAHETAVVLGYTF